jgi:hypothetical protein
MTDLEAWPNQLFFYEPLSFATATGYLANLGNIVQFDTYTNTQTALTGGTTPPGVNITTGEIYRDMGKTVHIDVVTNGFSQRVATLTKVQLYTTPGQSNEGVTGGPGSSTTSATNAYRTGYVVTWSANPSTNGVPVSVTRIGY